MSVGRIALEAIGPSDGVELRGLEPLTFALPARRSPS